MVILFPLSLHPLNKDFEGLINLRSLFDYHFFLFSTNTLPNGRKTNG